jgi:hypothetical protein
VGLAGAAGLVLAIVALGHRGSSARAAPPLALSDEVVVSAEDLRNRREVRAEDFRPRDRSLRESLRGVEAPAASTGEPPPQPSPEALSERARRRQADPEDVLALRRRAPSASAAPSPPPAAPLFSGPIYVEAGAAPSGSDPGSPRTPARASARIPAGTTLPAKTLTPLGLGGGGATVIVQVEPTQGALGGGRFVGTASVSAGRIAMRFAKLLLADGRELRVEAEACDRDGAFGIRVGGSDEADGGDDGIGQVAKDTASDLLTGALGGGLAGRATDSVLRRSSRHQPVTSHRSLSLPAGTPIQVFVHEAAAVP